MNSIAINERASQTIHDDKGTQMDSDAIEGKELQINESESKHHTNSCKPIRVDESQWKSMNPTRQL